VPGGVFALWVKVRGEVRGVIVLSAGRTEAAGDAVCRAIAEYTGADADGRKSSAVAGQGLWRKINDPREVDPGDPEQNPPLAPPRGTAQDDLRNFLGTLLVVRGNQQAVARTLRELLEAEQALYRQAQGNMLQLADNVRLAIEGSGEEGKPEHRTPPDDPQCGGLDCRGCPGDTVRWRVALCRRGDPQRDRRGIRRRPSLLPAGSAKSLSADTVDGVLEKMSEVMAQARSDLAEREKDITSALQHNREALASLRRQAEDAKVNSPVVPAQPAIVDAAAGSISSRLHPR
jgi:hypothetical protein